MGAYLVKWKLFDASISASEPHKVLCSSRTGAPHQLACQYRTVEDTTQFTPAKEQMFV